MRQPTNIRLGQLVTASAGRDTGKTYVVIGVQNEVLLLANGRERKTVNPKKKNVKHVIGHTCVGGMLKEKILQGTKVTDAELRSAVKLLETSESKKLKERTKGESLCLSRMLSK